MNKQKLKKAVDNNITETKEALQTVVDELNQGQRKKIVKNERVKELLGRYGVDYK